MSKRKTAKDQNTTIEWAFFDAALNDRWHFVAIHETREEATETLEVYAALEGAEDVPMCVVPVGLGVADALEEAQAEIERLTSLLELAEFGANSPHRTWNKE